MDKHKKFLDLAEKRVSKAIRDIQLVANLANTSSYEYSETEAKKIISALDKEVKNLKNKFLETNTSKEQTLFSF